MLAGWNNLRNMFCIKARAGYWLASIDINKSTEEQLRLCINYLYLAAQSKPKQDCNGEIQGFKPGIFRVNCDGRVAEHGLDTSGGHDDLVAAAVVELVRERRQHAELHFVGICEHGKDVIN